MHEPLAHGGRNLAVLADDRAVRAEIDLGVEHRAHGIRNLLADADHDVGIGIPRSSRQRPRLRSRNLDGILEQLGRKRIGYGAGCGVMMVPDRVRRDEAFRKSDDACAVAPGLANKAAGLLR